MSYCFRMCQSLITLALWLALGSCSAVYNSSSFKSWKLFISGAVVVWGNSFFTHKAKLSHSPLPILQKSLSCF